MENITLQETTNRFANVLLQFKIKKGDHADKGDIIAKGDNEVEVFEEGFIQKILTQPDEKFPVGTMLALMNSDSNPAPKEIPPPFQEPSIQPISPEISPMPPSPMEPKPIEISPFQEPGEKPIPEEMPPKEPIEPLPIEVPPKKEPGEKPIPDDLPPKKEPTPEKEPPIEAPPVEEPPTKEPVDVLTLTNVTDLNGYWKNDAII